MPDVFHKTHYFIVFHPGSAGNFIAGVVKNLINSTLAPLSISASGSSHSTAIDKINNLDHLSCGTFLFENNKFSNFDEKLEFHKNRIRQLSIQESQVSWSHDFTNIPLYKTLFPNSKILVITQESIEEKLATTILQVIKNFLDQHGTSPANINIKNEQEKRWENWAFRILSKILGDAELSIKIIKDRHNPEYKDLIEYVTIYGKMKYYNLLQYFNDPPYEKDFANTVLYPVYDNPVKNYIIGKDYTYYTHECVKIPYQTIMSNDSANFLRCMEKFIGEIDNQQQDYIIENFNRYYTAQNKNILIDPKQYFLNLRSSAFNLAKQLK